MNTIRGRFLWNRLTQLRLLACLAWAAAVATHATETALAQSDSLPQATSAEYQQLVDRGVVAYTEQRPAEARSLFAQAHALQPGARTLRALGIADLALDNYTLAKDELAAALKEPVMALTDNQRVEVQGLLDWMQGNLGTLHLSVTPLNAEAKIDGRSVQAPAVLLAPQEHRLTISARGFVPQEHTFTISMDQPMKLVISLARAAAPMPSIAEPKTQPEPVAMPVPARAPDLIGATQHDKLELWPWLGGAGAVLLVSGGTLFAFGMSDKASVEHAKSPVHLSEIEAAHDRVPWLTGVGLSLGIAGIAGVGAAAIMLLTKREPRDDVAWTLQSGPTTIQMTRRF